MKSDRTNVWQEVASFRTAKWVFPFIKCALQIEVRSVLKIYFRNGNEWMGNALMDSAIIKSVA